MRVPKRVEARALRLLQPAEQQRQRPGAEFTDLGGVRQSAITSECAVNQANPLLIG
jgi:hypothetical protein